MSNWDQTPAQWGKKATVGGSESPEISRVGMEFGLSLGSEHAWDASLRAKGLTSLISLNPPKGLSSGVGELPKPQGQRGHFKSGLWIPKL